MAELAEMSEEDVRVRYTQMIESLRAKPVADLTDKEVKTLYNHVQREKKQDTATTQEIQKPTVATQTPEEQEQSFWDTPLSDLATTTSQKMSEKLGVPAHNFSVPANRGNFEPFENAMPLGPKREPMSFGSYLGALLEVPTTVVTAAISALPAPFVGAVNALDKAVKGEGMDGILLGFSDGVLGTMDALTYHPRTEMGSGFTAAAANVYDKLVGDSGRGLGNIAFEHEMKNGATPEQAAFSATIAEMVPHVLTMLAGGKLLKRNKEAFQEGQDIARIKTELNVNRVAEQKAKGITTSLPDAMTQKVLANDVVDIIQYTVRSDEAQWAKFETYMATQGKDKRISVNLGQAVKDGVIDPSGATYVMRKYGISQEELGNWLIDTAKLEGGGMNRYGQLANMLREAAKDDPKLRARLKASGFLENATFWDIYSFLAKMENTRKVALTSQLSTTMRNIETTAGMTVLDAAEKALSAVAAGTVRGIKERSPRPVVEEMQALGAYMNGLKPGLKKGDKLYKILEEAQGTYDHVLFRERQKGDNGFTVGIDVRSDVFVPGLMKVIHSANRLQERVIHRTLFEAELRYQLARKGMSLDDIDPKAIPKEMLDASFQKALQSTFSAELKNPRSRNAIRYWGENPFTAMIAPFPRFIANSVGRLVEYGPWGMLRFGSPKVWEQIGQNPTKAAGIAARSMMGTMMLSKALEMRSGADSDLKWYEWRLTPEQAENWTEGLLQIPGVDKETLEGGVIDTRPFAPFSTYLAIAEAMIAPHRMSPKDLLEATLGLSRVSGTTLSVVDFMRTTDKETGVDIMQKVAFEYVNSYFVPARTFKDINAKWDPADAIMRDVKNHDGWELMAAMFRNNFPILNRDVPPRYGPRKEFASFYETPVLKQLLGISIKHKTEVEQAIDRLNIPFSATSPRTGDPQADALVEKYWGRVGFGILKQGIEATKTLPPPTQRLLVRTLLQQTKALATGMAWAENPIVMQQVQWEKMDPDMRALTETLMGFNPTERTEFWKEQQSNAAKGKPVQSVLEQLPEAEAVPPTDTGAISMDFIQSLERTDGSLEEFDNAMNAMSDAQFEKFITDYAGEDSVLARAARKVRR